MRDIKPDPSVGNDVFSPANMRELHPHTEWYEFPGRPPRYVALWCVREAAGQGGETTLADGYQFVLERFTTVERDQLERTVCDWRSRTTLMAEEGLSLAARHPLLERCRDTLIVRFSTLDLRADSMLAKKYHAAGQDYFAERCVAVKIARGAVLIWDNWRMMHSRTAFSDRRRHLRRALIADRT